MPRYLVVSDTKRCLVEAGSPEFAVQQAKAWYAKCKNWRPYLSQPTDEVAFSTQQLRQGKTPECSGAGRAAGPEEVSGRIPDLWTLTP